MYNDRTRFYVLVAVTVGIVGLWFAMQTVTGSAAEAASATAIEAAERLMKFDRRGERTLLIVSAIFGCSVVLAAAVIPYVAWSSNEPDSSQLPVYRNGSRPAAEPHDRAIQPTASSGPGISRTHPSHTAPTPRL